MRVRVLALLSLMSCSAARVEPFRGQTLAQEAPVATAHHGNSVSYIPAKVDAASTEFLEESGGQTHFIVGRMRMTRHENGRLETSARDRLPDAVRGVTHLPEHLGGGFVFHSDFAAYFAPYFSAALVPLERVPNGLKIGTGADVFYVFGPNQGFSARDPKTGAVVAQPVLPPLPEIDQIFAVSDRVVVASGPVVGTVKSIDGGRSWQRVEFDDVPLALSRVSGNVVLSLDPTAQGWFGSAPAKVYHFKPRVLLADGSWGESESRAAQPVAPKINDSLREAVLRGFPLPDGTVVYAEHGELIRVSIETGGVIERATHAFDNTAATCTAVALPSAREPKAFGFVCGSRFGKTDIFRYENNGLSLVRSFNEPRLVRPSGNDRLIVEGSCGAGAQGARRSLCIIASSGVVRAFDLSGAVDDARAVAMSDGRLALVTPPTLRTLATLTLIGASSAKRVVLKWPSVAKIERDVLQKGAWLEDFQERRPGVIGGWASRGGHLVGFEIDIDGTLRIGQLIYELGQTVVSGSFGLGWLPSRRGYETSDGGMHWKGISLPVPLGGARELRCSAIGCANAGWLRVGWGERAGDAAELRQPTSLMPSGRLATPLSLQCEAVLKPRLSVSRPEDRYSRPNTPLPPTKFAVFAGEPGPIVKVGERGFAIEAGAVTSYDRNIGGTARVFAWGDPNRTPNWQAKWMTLGSSKVYTSRITPAPAATLEGLRAALSAQRYSSTWSVVPGQMQGHALILGKRNYPAETLVLYAVDGQPLTEVRRPDGSAFSTIVAALEHAGTLALLEQIATSEVRLWTIDGGGARVVSRFGYRSGVQLRLAESEGRIGMVMTTNQRQPLDEWLFAPSPSGEWAWPVPLGSLQQMGARICSKGEVGWRSLALTHQSISLSDSHDRRVTPSNGTSFMLEKEGAICYESLALRVTSADLNAFGKEPLATGAKGEVATIPVALIGGESRLDLRCRLGAR